MSTPTPVPLPDPTPTFFGIPINRVVAFVGPHVSWVSGVIAAWLVAKVNIAGIKGLDEANTATWIAGAITFVVTAGLTWFGHQKWLTGFQAWAYGVATGGPGVSTPVLVAAPQDALDGPLLVDDASAEHDLPYNPDEFGKP